MMTEAVRLEDDCLLFADSSIHEDHVVCPSRKPVSHHLEESWHQQPRAEPLWDFFLSWSGNH